MKISKNMIEALNLILGNDFSVRMNESYNAFHFFNRNGKPCVGTINGHSMLIIMQKDDKPFENGFNIDANDFLDPIDIEIENIGNHNPQSGCDIQMPLKMFEREDKTENLFNMPIDKMADFNKIAKTLKSTPILKRINDCIFGFFEMGNYCAIMLVMCMMTHQNGFNMIAEAQENFEKEMTDFIDITSPIETEQDLDKVAMATVKDDVRQTKNAQKSVKQSKNDCTKQNSELIEAFTSENDIEIAKSFVSGHFNTDIELVANSKTQYKITDAAGNEFPGYRLIRSGRQWQIRRLNEVMEAQGSDMTENKIETMQENQVIEPENKVEISKNTPALLALPQAPMALPAIWKETENQVENIIVDPVQENIMKLYNGAMARIALKKHIKAELMPSGNEILMYKEEWIRKSGRKFKHVDYHKVVKDNIDLINYYSVTGYDILILLDDIEVIEYLIGISNISIDEIRKNSIKKLLRYIP